MKIKITKSDENTWYRDCIGEVFPVQSESRKGGKGKWVVNIPYEYRRLVNGYMYGWVDKNDCQIVEIYSDEKQKYNID